VVKAGVAKSARAGRLGIDLPETVPMATGLTGTGLAASAGATTGVLVETAATGVKAVPGVAVRSN